jgi:FkbM family methyltransferase
MLMEHIFHKSVRHKIIVDVGAHGTSISNSFDLVKKLNWKGILIEADPVLIPIIRRDCADLDVDIINVSISNYDGDADFFVSDGRVLSSLDPTIMESLGHSPQSMVRVPVRRLAPLLRERAIPNDFDILSLDIEGEDVRTLNDLIDNSDYRPRWVIIEADHGFSHQALDKAEFSETVRSSYRVIGITFANILLEAREF